MGKRRYVRLASFPALAPSRKQLPISARHHSSTAQLRRYDYALSIPTTGNEDTMRLLHRGMAPAA
jgi:hypothetical protein